MSYRLFNVRSSTRSLLAVVVAAIAFVGCASPAKHDAMTADVIAVRKHTQTVTVTVSGGKETNPAWKSQVSDQAFRQAIVDSIEKSQVFSKVVDSSGNYLLNAVIINMEQPSFGFSFTVKMEAGWTLKRADTGAVIWQEVIKSEHTATTSDAFAGVARLRIANEGAVKNNISQALAKISALNF